MKESSAEVDIRIGGRSRKRVRRICRITDKGLAFLLEFGGALFPWLECIPKNIVGNVNLHGANNRIRKDFADNSLEAVFGLQNVFAEIEERLKRQEKQ